MGVTQLFYSIKTICYLEGNVLMLNGVDCRESGCQFKALVVFSCKSISDIQGCRQVVKSSDFDSDMRRFESFHPCHFHLKP